MLETDSFLPRKIAVPDTTVFEFCEFLSELIKNETVDQTVRQMARGLLRSLKISLVAWSREEQIVGDGEENVE
jgi:hypothetical protein